MAKTLACNRDLFAQSFVIGKHCSKSCHPWLGAPGRCEQSKTSVLDFPGGQYEVLVGCVLVTLGQERRREGNRERKEREPHLHREIFSSHDFPLAMQNSSTRRLSSV